MLSRAYSTAAYESTGTQLTKSTQTFDPAGNVLTSTDGRGSVTSCTYDPTGPVLPEKQPTSSSASILTSFGYDLNGNRTRYTDGRGNAFWSCTVRNPAAGQVATHLRARDMLIVCGPDAVYLGDAEFACGHWPPVPLRRARAAAVESGAGGGLRPTGRGQGLGPPRVAGRWRRS